MKETDVKCRECDKPAEWGFDRCLNCAVLTLVEGGYAANYFEKLPHTPETRYLRTRLLHLKNEIEAQPLDAIIYLAILAQYQELFEVILYLEAGIQHSVYSHCLAQMYPPKRNRPIEEYVPKEKN